MLTRQLHSVEEVLSGFALLPELFGDCLGRNSSQVRKFHLCIFSLLVQSLWNDHLSPFQQWRTLSLKGCHLLSSCPTSQTLFGKHWVNSSEILLKSVHSEKKTMGTFRWMLELTFLPNGESPGQDVYCPWLVGRRLSLFRRLNPSLLPHGSKRLSLSTAPLSPFPSLVCLNDEKCSSSFFFCFFFPPGQSPPPPPFFSLKMNTFLFKATAGFLHPSSPTVQRRSTSMHNASYSDTLLTFQAPCPLATGSSPPLFLPRLALVALVKDICGIALIWSPLGTNAHLSCESGRRGRTGWKQIQVFSSGLVLWLLFRAWRWDVWNRLRVSMLNQILQGCDYISTLKAHSCPCALVDLRIWNTSVECCQSCQSYPNFSRYALAFFMLPIVPVLSVFNMIFFFFFLCPVSCDVGTFHASLRIIYFFIVMYFVLFYCWVFYFLAKHMFFSCACVCARVCLWVMNTSESKITEELSQLQKYVFNYF